MKFYKKDDLVEEMIQCLRTSKEYVNTSPVLSKTKKFMMHRWSLMKAGSTFTLHIRYKVPRTDTSVMFYHFVDRLTSVAKAVDCLMDLIWEASPCSECYRALVKDKYCENCCFYHVINDHGLETKKINEIPKCTICLEDVLHSQLSCGHYFHLDCLVALNEKGYFTEEDKLNGYCCPNCRKEFNWFDYKNVFLFDDNREDDEYSVEFEDDIDEEEDAEDDYDDDEEDYVTSDENEKKED